jgi:hypothetical protein
MNNENDANTSATMKTRAFQLQLIRMAMGGLCMCSKIPSRVVERRALLPVMGRARVIARKREAPLFSLPNDDQTLQLHSHSIRLLKLILASLSLPGSSAFT